MAIPHYQFEYPFSYEDALSRAAAACSIDLVYWDIFRKEHRPSQDALKSILSSLGWDVSSQDALGNELLSRFENAARKPIKKTSVIGESDKALELTLPFDAAGTLNFQLHLEDGRILAETVEICQLVPLREISSRNIGARIYRLALPTEAPLGYHELRLQLNGAEIADANIVICPEKAYLPENLEHDGKTAGFNLTLYGLRSDRNWGCGDFTDLKKLLEWAHREVGFSFVGLNPLHALHNRVPYNTSPYLPLSTFYKNHIYIDVEHVPEFNRSSWAQALRQSEKVKTAIQQARDAEFVAYHDVDLFKTRFLKILYREFRRSAPADRKKAFDDFCSRECDLLHNYALYRALDEILHKRNRNVWTWRQWPAEYQDPHSTGCQEFARQYPRLIEFHQYVQFVLEEQLRETQSHAHSLGMSIGLYHDLAVATDNAGSDLWAYRSFYAQGCRVGSPPDDFSPNGQDWSFPPPCSQTHIAGGYRLFRESVRKIVRNGGALRLDHVMRLFRLFWIPAGMDASQGTYVRDNAADLMHILALESVRSKNIVIGEDLGTVTDEIRDMLARFRILSYRLLFFEKNPNDGSFIASSKYPRQALVSSSTHDLATLVGFWNYRDIEARRAANLVDDAGYQWQKNSRNNEKQRMLDVLHQERLIPDDMERDASKIPEVNGDLHNGIIGFLAQVPSMILLLNQEDFTKETEQQNLPGSTAEYPNWQRKMKVKIEELRTPAIEPCAAKIRHQLARTGRV